MTCVTQIPKITILHTEKSQIFSIDQPFELKNYINQGRYGKVFYYKYANLDLAIKLIYGHKQVNSKLLRNKNVDAEVIITRIMSSFNEYGESLLFLRMYDQFVAMDHSNNQLVHVLIMDYTCCSFGQLIPQFYAQKKYDIIVSIIAQVVIGLYHVHQRVHYVHGDLHCSNVMITKFADKQTCYIEYTQHATGKKMYIPILEGHMAHVVDHGSAQCLVTSKNQFQYTYGNLIINHPLIPQNLHGKYEGDLFIFLYTSLLSFTKTSNDIVKDYENKKNEVYKLLNTSLTNFYSCHFLDLVQVIQNTFTFVPPKCQVKYFALF